VATHLFSTLIRDVESELWDEHELAKLPLLELQSLADLLACARAGTKAEVLTKIPRDPHHPAAPPRLCG
jgi:hypothetical protein